MSLRRSTAVAPLLWLGLAVACGRTPLGQAMTTPDGRDATIASPSGGGNDGGGNDGAGGGNGGGSHPPDAQGDRVTEVPPPTDVGQTPDRGPDMNTDGSTAAADHPIPVAVPPLRLTKLFDTKEGAWQPSQWSPPMAVDGRKRLYLSDGLIVYEIDGTSAKTFHSSQDLARIVTSRAISSNIRDLDIDDAGTLYFLISPAVITTSEPFQGMLLALHAERETVFRLGVVGPGQVALVGRDGLATLTRLGQTAVYSEQQIGGGDNCAAQDFAVGRDGTFLYQPGCNGSPLYRGRIDGSGVEILATTGRDSVVDANNFLCITRDLAGGFFALVSQRSDRAPALYHVSSELTGAAAFTSIPTTPSLASAAIARTHPFAFEHCSLAAAADGTLFLQTWGQIWKMEP